MDLQDWAKVGLTKAKVYSFKWGIVDKIWEMFDQKYHWDALTRTMNRIIGTTLSKAGSNCEAFTPHKCRDLVRGCHPIT
jgi:hypothetical protein